MAGSASPAAARSGSGLPAPVPDPLGGAQQRLLQVPHESHHRSGRRAVVAKQIGIEAGVAQVHQQGHFLGGQTQQVFVVVMDDFHRDLPKEKARRNCRTFAQSVEGPCRRSRADAAALPSIGGEASPCAAFHPGCSQDLEQTMEEADEAGVWRDRGHAGALLGQRLAAQVHHPQDTTVMGIPPGGMEVAAALAAVLQLHLSCWSVQRLCFPCRGQEAIGALAPGNIHLFDDNGLKRHGLDDEGRQELLRRQERRLEHDQRRFGDPGPAELSHRHLILVDEAIRSGLTMGAGLLSLRAFYPASITVAAPVGCLEALERLGPLADEVVVLRSVEQLPRLSDWFASLPPLGAREVIALLRAT